MRTTASKESDTRPAGRTGKALIKLVVAAAIIAIIFVVLSHIPS